MLRRSLVAATAAAVALTPAAAVAQDASEVATVAPTAPVEDATGGGLTWLAELIGGLSELLSASDGTDEAPPVDEATLQVRASIALLMESVLDGARAATVVDRAESGELELENELEEDADHGAIVSTVARCAPNGALAEGLIEGIRNHGQLVSTAARGGTVQLTVPDVTGTGADATVSDTTTEVAHTLTSLDAADALCTDLATLVSAKALSLGLPADASPKDIRQAERDARRAPRDRDQADRKTARDEAKAERRTARERAKVERKAEREGAHETGRGSSKGERSAGRRG